MKYIAYGSNLNLNQMARRCPTAKVVGVATLPNYQLTFCGVATIEKKEGAKTPVAVWEIDEACEEALDKYEGYPSLYRKENKFITVNGKKTKVMVYILNYGNVHQPNIGYFETIKQGYLDVGLDLSYLMEALERAEQ